MDIDMLHAFVELWVPHDGYGRLVVDVEDGG